MDDAIRRRRTKLLLDHTPAAVAARLRESARASLLGDAVLGAMDGAVTTFAIVAGAVGGGFAPRVALVLGFANVLADGISMSAGNYERVRSERLLRERARREEEEHVDLVPEGEREELRHIFAGKGFEGPVLESIVAHISSDRRRWVETMLVEEHGFAPDSRGAGTTALVTFASFVAVGLVPLLPFAFTRTATDLQSLFTASAVLTAASFFALGAVRGVLVRRPWIMSGLQTLLLGGAAAATAWAVGAMFGSRGDS